MGEIYLIRHGKTIANEQHLYCGSTDLSLSKAGAKELKKLHYRVPDNAVFVTSGRKRTEETMRLLFGERAHLTDTHFREVDFGRFEMKSYEQLKELSEYQDWITGDNEKNIPPEGESGEQMLQRVLEGFQALQAQDAPVVLISHGGVIAALMAHLFPEKEKNRYSWQPRPGHGYVLKNGSYQELQNDEKAI